MKTVGCPLAYCLLYAPEEDAGRRKACRNYSSHVIAQKNIPAGIFVSQVYRALETDPSGESRMMAQLTNRLQMVLMIVLLCAQVLPGVTQGADSPANAPVNSWVEVPNTKMASVTITDGKFPGVWGICGPHSVISAWSGAALDTKRSRLILFGGGHADYAGNELYSFDINAMKWERLTDPFINPKIDDSDENADGTPQSRHSYGGLAYLAHSDKFFALGGSIYQSGHGSCTKVWTFDFADKKWARAKDKPPFGAAYDCTCAYDPVTKKLWYCNYNMGCWAEVYCYESEGEKWCRIKMGEEPGYAGATIDTKRGLLVALSGGKVRVHDVRGSAPAQVWQTTGGDAFLKDREVGFDYDPVADKLVGWSADKVYVLDPDKKEWTVNDPPGAPKPSGNGTFGRWRYVPSVNAFILVTGISSNVHFYKLTAGSGKVEPPPAAAPQAAKVAPPPAPARDVEPQRAALRSVLQQQQAKVSASITVFGKAESVSFTGADETGIKVVLDGNALPLRWKDIQDADLANLAIACQPEGADALLNAGIVAHAGHKDALFDKILTRLLKVNADRAASLREACKGY